MTKWSFFVLNDQMKISKWPNQRVSVIWAEWSIFWFGWKVWIYLICELKNLSVTYPNSLYPKPHRNSLLWMAKCQNFIWKKYYIKLLDLLWLQTTSKRPDPSRLSRNKIEFFTIIRLFVISFDCFSLRLLSAFEKK